MNNVQIRGGYIVLVGSAEGCFSVGDHLKQHIDEVFAVASEILFVLYLERLV